MEYGAGIRAAKTEASNYINFGWDAGQLFIYVDSTKVITLPMGTYTVN